MIKSEVGGRRQFHGAASCRRGAGVEAGRSPLEVHVMRYLAAFPRQPQGPVARPADPLPAVPAAGVPGEQMLDQTAAAGLATLLDALVLADASDGAVLAAMRGFQRLIGWASAGLLDAAAEVHARRTGPATTRQAAACAAGDAAALQVEGRSFEMASRAVADEVALELSCSRWLAERLVDTATTLTGEMPATLDALRSGRLDPRKAETIAAGLSEVGDVTVRKQVEARLLGVAANMNVPTLRERIKEELLRAEPERAAEAAVRARAYRRVLFTPAPEDMIELWALLPADDGMRLRTVLDHAADRARHPGDPRSVDQRRTDALVDAVLGTLNCVADDQPRADEQPVGPGCEDAGRGVGPGTGRRLRSRRPKPGPKHQVAVTVPLETITGETEQPGYLARYGPITADLARRMAWEVASKGTWRCVVTDDEHGTVLGLGASTFTPEYEPPEALRRHLVMRDRVCRFAGCRAQAVRCDIDHRVPHPAGATCECNHESLCGHHHRVKHETAFRVRLSTDDKDPPGTLIWTTPGGREYPDYPAQLRPPSCPEPTRATVPKPEPRAAIRPERGVPPF